MARSAEALKRRAEKRHRTETQQRRADALDGEKRAQRLLAKEQRNPQGSSTEKQIFLAPNQPLQHTQRTKKGGARRAAPASNYGGKRDFKWAEQAGPERILYNHKLRQSYAETGGTGMSDEDIARAKILISRDDRKKAKKRLAKRKDVRKHFRPSR